jgi:hypothetical protein
VVFFAAVFLAGEVFFAADFFTGPDFFAAVFFAPVLDAVFDPLLAAVFFAGAEDFFAAAFLVVAFLVVAIFSILHFKRFGHLCRLNKFGPLCSI